LRSASLTDFNIAASVNTSKTIDQREEADMSCCGTGCCDDDGGCC
jgi:hypothetical protein